MSDLRLSVHAASIAALFILSTSPASAQGGLNGVTTRVNLTALGQQVFNSSSAPSISRDGTRIAFETSAALVPSDTNGVLDIYVVEPATGAVMIASNASGGAPGNGASFAASLSGDGRWVAFTTLASNLSGFDTNGDSDVMLKDLQTGALRRVSAFLGSIMAAPEASASPSVSFDGRYVAFATLNEFSAADNNDNWDIYVRDMQLDTFALVSHTTFGTAGNSSSLDPAISDDGQHVAFASFATNLVLGDTNLQRDVFVRSSNGSMELVSKVPGGAQGNDQSWGASISADGRHVAFTTAATNFLVGDGNGDLDVYVVDRMLDTLRLVNRSVLGTFCAIAGASDPSISADGRVVAFTSSALDLTSDATPFTSIYVRDMTTSVSRLASRPTGPTQQPNGASYAASLSSDGSVVAFRSGAANLVSGDVNGVFDVFTRTMAADPDQYCTSSVTGDGCEPTLSSTGVARASQASGFVVTCTDAPNNKAGLLFYGINGRLHAPFLAGTMCVQLPVARTPIAFSGGNPSTVSDCSGSFSLDMNAFAAGALGGSPLPELSVVGQRVNVQYWGRDPSGPIATTFLSDALEYVVGP